MINTMKAIAAIMLTVVLMLVAGCKPEDGPNNGGGNNGENNGSNDSDVRVTTYPPKDITWTTAKCGGDVIVTQGLTLTELGVCWSTESNPTIEDFHLSTNNWSEPYVCTITGLTPGTTYHVRAYALRGLEYYYGMVKNFTTEENGGGGWNGFEFVDLGLPSGTLWATYNIGAATPEEYGDYFAWGETNTKSNYTWYTYKYCKGTHVENGSTLKTYLTKYCNDASSGYHGFTDDLITLLPEDDAATVNWGSGWCMPTFDQWMELVYNTTIDWRTQNSVNGWLFTASNGNSLFLPAAGIRWYNDFYDAGRFGDYWSSSLFLGDDYSGPTCARSFDFGPSNYDERGCSIRYCGMPIRPVHSSR